MEVSESMVVCSDAVDCMSKKQELRMMARETERITRQLADMEDVAAELSQALDSHRIQRDRTKRKIEEVMSKI